MTTDAAWTVVVPVKGTAESKSRLGASRELALAIALDTVAAALEVARVIVVTSASAAPRFSALGASVVQDTGRGLTAAVETGLAAASSSSSCGAAGPVAVLLGDVPAVTAAELAGALGAAARHPLAFVPDADGVGSVLIAAAAGVAHAPAFGPGSRAAHLAAGYVELRVAADSGLRRDVDTAEQLAALATAGRLGPRTAALAG